MFKLTSLEEKVRKSLERNAEELRTQYLETSESDIRSVLRLTELELDCNQYVRLTDDCFESIRRICLVRIRMSPDDIAKNFGVEVVHINYVGVLIPIEGIFLSSATRDKLHYDSCIQGKKGVKYDTSFLPDEIVDSYEFRLAIPAFSGLFVPKKCSLTDSMSSVKCLEYVDVSEGM